MRTLISALLICCVLFICQAKSGVLQVKSGDNLQTALDNAASGDTVKIGEGEFAALPSVFNEQQCGNCEEQNTSVVATRGFIIDGKSLVIIGAGPLKTKLVTNAGYGILFINSNGSVISNLSITGGKRDSSGNATDAGIVIKNSAVKIKNVHIKDNNNQVDGVVVGIAGIVGREDSEIEIDKCIIRNNSWDGIALYRGAKATITDNLIEQGRGAGIGITWDAQATVLRNSVSFYWKGIGTFGTSKAVVKNNAVFENIGWGIVITGSSNMEAGNNVITKNGNCGLAVWDSTASGKIYNNVITDNGWRDEWVCPQVGMWMNGDTARVEFIYNNVWSNVMGNYRNIPEQTGINGNISSDPQFVPDSDYKTKPESILRKSGNPSVKNPDRSRSHIGLEGGPSAKTK